MPYIPLKKRKLLWNGEPPHSVGELNYLITSEVLDYLGIPDGRKPNYTDYNEMIGMLRLVELELWDRLIRPYEKKKREENGDVF